MGDPFRAGSRQAYHGVRSADDPTGRGAAYRDTGGASGWEAEPNYSTDSVHNGEYNASQDSAQAALEAGRAGGFVSPDPTAHAYQMQAMDAMGRRAFGGLESDYGQGLEAAITSPYAAQRGPQGASLASGMAQALSTQGAQAAQSAGQGLGYENAAQQRRLGAVGDYGQQAGAMRRQSDQLAQFNAQQQGDLTSHIYDALYGTAQANQQRNDQRQANQLQGIEQMGLGMLGPLAALL